MVTLSKVDLNYPPEVVDGIIDRLDKLEAVAACLLDHYMSSYGMNDMQEQAGNRDALAAEAEHLVPHWRKLRDEWKPKAK